LRDLQGKDLKGGEARNLMVYKFTSEEQKNAHLLALSPEACSLWMPNIGGVMNFAEDGKYEIAPDRIKVVYGRPKPLSVDAMEAVALRRKNMKEIMENL